MPLSFRTSCFTPLAEAALQYTLALCEGYITTQQRRGEDGRLPKDAAAVLQAHVARLVKVAIPGHSRRLGVPLPVVNLIHQDRRRLAAIK